MVSYILKITVKKYLVNLKVRVSLFQKIASIGLESNLDISFASHLNNVT
jgi:hypothetical protein